jgi:hypothetical protein
MKLRGMWSHELVYLAQDKDQWEALTNVIIN